MKFRMQELVGVAVVALVAGCATEPEQAGVAAKAATAVEAKKPEVKAPPKAETFAEAYRRHLNAVCNWGYHSFAYEAVAGVPAAMKFLEENAEKEQTHSAEFRTLRIKILAALDRGGDFETGIALAQTVYDDAKAGGDRLPAARYLAMGIVDRTKDYAKADSLYVVLLEDARTSKDRNAPNVLQGVVRERAYLYTLRGDEAGAIRYIDSERAKATGDEKQKAAANRAFDERAGEVFNAFIDYKGAVAYFAARGNKAKLFSIYARGELDDVPAMAKVSREIVLDESFDGWERLQAWVWLFWHDEKFCDETAKMFLAKDPGGFASVLGSAIWRGGSSFAYCRNPWKVAKLWEYYVPAAEKAKARIDFRPAQYAALAYAELGDREKARAAIAKGLANDKLGPLERFELQLMERTLDFKGREDEIVHQAKAAVEELAKGLKREDVKDYAGRAFAIATVGRDETLKRGVAKYYLAYVRATPPKKSYTVRFSNRTVAGAGDWANLPFKPDESAFDRKFGGSGMDFMTTDVATGDRGNAVQGGERAREHPTTLQAVADEWGVHLVYTFYDKRARQFETGELDCGSYESYLAPGENTPYVCLMNYPKKDAHATVMNTSYDQPGHRRVKAGDSNQFRSDVYFADDRIVNYMGISWDVFADRIPEDGAEWEFESVFWGPVPCAWNGLETIHGRSTWGKLRMELGEAGRTKIRRAQLFKAARAYKAESTPNQALPDSVQEGIFSHWYDDELGDPEFYEKCLKPYRAELDKVVERVNSGMSDEEANAIAKAYLARLRNVRFDVAKLRAKYLAEKLTDK